MNALKLVQSQLTQPGLARLMQIAYSVKHALSVDETIVFGPVSSPGQPLPLIWDDTANAEPWASVTEPATQQSRRILTQDQVFSLTVSQLDHNSGAVHYYQRGGLWHEAMVEDEEVQAIRLQYQHNGHRYLILWVRQDDRPFTKADRETFDQLLETATKADDHHRLDASSSAPVEHDESEPTPIFVRPLSPMESKVLELLRAGCTERAIAERLGRSPNTIHVHVRNIYRKLFVGSRAELYARVGRKED